MLAAGHRKNVSGIFDNAFVDCLVGRAIAGMQAINNVGRLTEFEIDDVGIVKDHVGYFHFGCGLLAAFDYLLIGVDTNE